MCVCVYVCMCVCVYVCMCVCVTSSGVTRALWALPNFRATGPGAQVELLKNFSRVFVWQKLTFLDIFNVFSEIGRCI